MTHQIFAHILSNDLRKVEEILKQNPLILVSEQDAQTNTPFWVAINTGKYDIAHSILKNYKNLLHSDELTNAALLLDLRATDECRLLKNALTDKLITRHGKARQARHAIVCYLASEKSEESKTSKQHPYGNAREETKQATQTSTSTSSTMFGSSNASVSVSENISKTEKPTIHETSTLFVDAINISFWDSVNTGHYDIAHTLLKKCERLLRSDELTNAALLLDLRESTTDKPEYILLKDALMVELKARQALSDKAETKTPRLST